VAVLAGVALEDMLARGFTTVSDAGGADAGIGQTIEQGATTAPPLLVSGRPLTQTGGHGDQRSAPDFRGRGCGEHVGLVVTDGDVLEDLGLLGRDGGVVLVVLGGRVVHIRLA
jgi:hypothetical protein